MKQQPLSDCQTILEQSYTIPTAFNTNFRSSMRHALAPATILLESNRPDQFSFTCGCIVLVFPLSSGTGPSTSLLKTSCKLSTSSLTFLASSLTPSFNAFCGRPTSFPFPYFCPCPQNCRRKYSTNRKVVAGFPIQNHHIRKKFVVADKKNQEASPSQRQQSVAGEQTSTVAPWKRKRKRKS